MYIVKINDTWGGANFDPRAIICTILLEVHHTMFHAKHLNSNLCKFKEDDFLSFYYIHIRETYGPQGGLILTLEAKF
jgi:hypothetical protein